MQISPANDSQTTNPPPPKQKRQRNPKKVTDYSKTVIYYIEIEDDRHYGFSAVPLQYKKADTVRVARKNLANDKPSSLNSALYRDLLKYRITPEDIEFIPVETIKCDNATQAKNRAFHLYQQWRTSQNVKKALQSTTIDSRKSISIDKYMAEIEKNTYTEADTV
jgi:hypothetical protein